MHAGTMGNLPYIIWGVIPLLRRYYDHDFKEKESYVDEAVGKRICKLLMVIVVSGCQVSQFIRDTHEF